ncbi:MAG: potassium channel family protein [Eubacteriaceae bacterium]
MKIAIVGGHNEADFLIGMLLKKSNKLLVINDDEKYCTYLASQHKIPIYNGDGGKHYVLEDVRVHKFDILIALTDNDSDNLFICQAAKRMFGVKRVVCLVSNPKNVDIFKKLGVNTVISATYLVAQFIEQASTVEKLTNTFTIADHNVLLSEVDVEANSSAIGKKLFQLQFPQGIVVSCLIRDLKALVPNGQTEILEGDKLLIISSPENKNIALSVITGGNNEK